MFKNFFQKYGNKELKFKRSPVEVNMANWRSGVDFTSTLPPAGSISHIVEVDKTKENNEIPANNASFEFRFEKASIFVAKCINILTKIFVSAIIYLILAHFVPELREKLPDMYRVVDALLSVLNGIFSFVLSIFGL